MWPDPRDADELHDGLLTAGVLTEAEGERGREGSWTSLFDELREAGRAGRVGRNGARPAWWVSAERLPEVEAVLGPGVSVEPALTPPGELAQQTWTRPSALLELVRGRVQMSGPVTASGVARDLGLDRGDLDAAFIALEGQGVVLRGSFTGQSAEIEWCERRLLARIHRYTLNRLRAEIEPVSQADFMRFLFAWQKVAEGHRMSGLEGLAAVVSQLEGFETPAGAWETDVLGGRVSGYDPQLLDNLCLTGRVTWGRISPPHRNGNGRPGPGPIRSTPIALLNRDRLQMWLQRDRVQDPAALSTYASAVHAVLEDRGASFFSELVGRSGLLPTQVEDGLGELVANGLVTADSFTGLRALLVPSDRRRSLGGTKARSRRRQPPNFGVDSAGRWSLLAAPPPDDDAGTSSEEREEIVEAVALTLLRRYGVLFRRLLRNEARTPPWWEAGPRASPPRGQGRRKGRPFRGWDVGGAVRSSGGGRPTPARAAQRSGRLADLAQRSGPAQPDGSADSRSPDRDASQDADRVPGRCADCRARGRGATCARRVRLRHRGRRGAVPRPSGLSLRR